MTNKSFNTAVTYLKRYYTNSHGGDTLSKEEWFKVLGKNPTSGKDKAVIHTQISVMRDYGLITSTRSEEGFKPLISITLTDKGRNVLGYNDGQRPNGVVGIKPYEPPMQQPKPPTPKTMSLQEITDMVKEWNRQNPSFWIDPTPKLIDKDMPIVQR